MASARATMASHGLHLRPTRQTKQALPSFLGLPLPYRRMADHRVPKAHARYRQ